VRDWLRYERAIASERRRIAQRRRRGSSGPSRRPIRRRELAPRWLVVLDLLLGALVLAGKVSPLIWVALALAAMLAFALLASLVLALWQWLIIALALYAAWRALRRFLTYRRESAEIPF
jgi:hypothetical protein